MKKKIIATVFATIISSGLLGLLLLFNTGIFYLPGILYGILTAFLFFYLFRSGNLRLMGWSIASMVTWFISYFVCMITWGSTVGFVTLDAAGASSHDPIFAALSYILAGSVGSGLLSLAYRFLIEKHTFIHGFFLPIITGGLASVSFLIIPEIMTLGNGLPLEAIPFFIWQTAVTLALVLPSKKEVAEQHLTS